MTGRPRAKVPAAVLVAAAFGALAFLSVRTNLADIRSLRYERTEGVVTVSEPGPAPEPGWFNWFPERYGWRLE